MPDSIAKDPRVKTLQERHFVEEIMRGLRKNKDYTRISLKQYAKSQGRTHTNVARMVRSLIQRGIVIRLIDNGKEGRLYGLIAPTSKGGKLAPLPEGSRICDIKRKTYSVFANMSIFCTSANGDPSHPSTVIADAHSCEVFSLYPFKKKVEEANNWQQPLKTNQNPIKRESVIPESLRFWTSSSSTRDGDIGVTPKPSYETLTSSDATEMTWAKPETTAKRKDFIRTWNRWKRQARLSHDLTTSGNALQVNNIVEQYEDAQAMLDRFLDWCQNVSRYEGHSIGLFLKMAKEGELGEDSTVPPTSSEVQPPPVPPAPPEPQHGASRPVARPGGSAMKPVSRPAIAAVAPPERTFTTEAQIMAWNAALPTRKVFGLTAALDAQFQAALDAGLGDPEAFKLFLEKTSAMARHEKGAFVTLPWLLKTGEKGANWLRVLNCEYDWMIQQEEEKAPAVDYEKDADKSVSEPPPHPFWDTMYCDELHGLMAAKRVIIANDWLNWRIFTLMEGETYEEFLAARELYKSAWNGDAEAAAKLLDETGITVEDIGRFIEDMKNGVERFPERFDFRKNRAQRKPWLDLPRSTAPDAVPDTPRG